MRFAHAWSLMLLLTKTTFLSSKGLQSLLKSSILKKHKQASSCFYVVKTRTNIISLFLVKIKIFLKEKHVSLDCHPKGKGCSSLFEFKIEITIVDKNK